MKQYFLFISFFIKFIIIVEELSLPLATVAFTGCLLRPTSHLLYGISPSSYLPDVQEKVYYYYFYFISLDFFQNHHHQPCSYAITSLPSSITPPTFHVLHQYINFFMFHPVSSAVTRFYSSSFNWSPSQHTSIGWEWDLCKDVTAFCYVVYAAVANTKWNSHLFLVLLLFSVIIILTVLLKENVWRKCKKKGNSKNFYTLRILDGWVFDWFPDWLAGGEAEKEPQERNNNEQKKKLLKKFIVNQFYLWLLLRVCVCLVRVWGEEKYLFIAG